MSISVEMKKIGEDIISSYKLRIKSVGEIVSETHHMLTDFQKEHKTMSDKLRKNFEKNEKDRLRAEKDRLQESNNLMAGITKEQVERNKYVTDLLIKYDNEQKIIVNELKVMAVELKKSLGKGETDRLEEFNKMMADVQNIQSDRNKYVADLLQKFADDQKITVNELKAMADELKKSLEKGETGRLEEFDKMMTDVQNIQSDRNKYVADLLKKFADDQKVIAAEHSTMAENWKVFNKTMSNLKSGKPIVEKKVKVRAVKEAIEEKKPEPVPEKPVEKPKPKPAKKVQPWEKDMPLEDKVLAFINAHPKGVKVGDMEEPLNVTRMRLGVIGKKLFETGKVKKADKVYFPI